MQQAAPQHAAPALDESAPAGLDEVVRRLRSGAAHSIESRSLALVCMGAAMPPGAWGAIVGMPDLGIEAARDLGVPIDRVALVPHPGRAWLDVAASRASHASPSVATAQLPRRRQIRATSCCSSRRRDARPRDREAGKPLRRIALPLRSA